jgi:SAM-dependent methyltransferase
MSPIWKTEQQEVWRYFGKRLVEISGIFGGAYVLDIGSGRGTSLLPAAKKVGPDGLVVGIDNWIPYIVGTTKEILARELPQASIIKMDAEKLGFAEGYFDFVLSGFSYCFCRMEDVRNVLKNGGKVSFSAWKWQDDLEWMGILVQKIVPEDKYADLSDMGIPTEDGRPWVYVRETKDSLHDLLSNAGFKDITIVEEKKEFLYRDEEHYWDIVTNSGWQHYLEIIKDMGDEALAGFKDDMFEYLQQYKDNKGIQHSRTVLLATGIKCT